MSMMSPIQYLMQNYLDFSGTTSHLPHQSYNSLQTLDHNLSFGTVTPSLDP
jgi:hypothetical protein